MTPGTPIISLWQPWASWVAFGWKTIETRMHSRFKFLEGRTIGIHAALKWDSMSAAFARPYLTEEQIAYSRKFTHIKGSIICTAKVGSVRWLTGSDSGAALINCHDTIRFGLVLTDVQLLIEPIQTKGRQGVWYSP